MQRQHTLVNKNKMQVTLSDFGARIVSIKFVNAYGDLIETTLNHKTEQEILNDTAYMGATVGRVCNRISGAAFALDKNIYKLDANEGKNTLHGGSNGFDKQTWATQGSRDNNRSIQFTLTSADGDQGFPGELSVVIEYTLTDNDELVITYHATTTKPTPINLCNHAYFNLGETDIRDLKVQINSAEYLPVDKDSIPLGIFHDVKDTKFDLQHLTDLNEVLDKDGYDHCYKTLESVCAVVKSKHTHIILEVETDHLGLQFYTGNHLPNKQSALCLEAQGYPDAINQDSLPHDILRPGDTYKRRVIYRYLHPTEI